MHQPDRGINSQVLLSSSTGNNNQVVNVNRAWREPVIAVFPTLDGAESNHVGQPSPHNQVPDNLLAYKWRLANPAG